MNLSQMKDLTLSSDWSVTLHDPSSTTDTPFTALGHFNTISGFWQIYHSAFLQQNITQTLPPRVNITLYRETKSHGPEYIKSWHGEWNIQLHYMTNPLQIYKKLVLLVIGEQLSNKIRGVVLQRVPVDPDKLNFSISIFTDCKEPKLDVKNILLSNDVINLNYCINKMAIFLPFKIIHIPMDENNNNNNNNNNQDFEQKESEEEMEMKVNDDNITYVKYNMQSLMQYSKLVETANLKYLNHPTNITNTISHVANVSNIEVVETPPPINTINPFLSCNKYRQCILKLFGKYANEYQISIVNTDELVSGKLHEILCAEGCVICMQTSLKSPYNKSNMDKKEKEKENKEEKEFSPIIKDNKILISEIQIEENEINSLIIAQCAKLGCQHIIHLECALTSNHSVCIKNKHCANFFETIDLSTCTNEEIQKEIGYHIDTKNVTDKTYYFSFKVNHLISNQNTVSPHWPIKVPSYYLKKKKEKEKKECLQIFFDHTKLQISRGMIQIAIITSNDNENDNDINNNNDNVFICNANFEIPSSDLIDRIKSTKLKNKIYQLKYDDTNAQNVLIININMQLKKKSPYSLQILSLRYEFNNNNNNNKENNIDDVVVSISNNSQLINVNTTRPFWDFIDHESSFEELLTNSQPISQACMSTPLCNGSMPISTVSMSSVPLANVSSMPISNIINNSIDNNSINNNNNNNNNNMFILHPQDEISQQNDQYHQQLSAAISQQQNLNVFETMAVKFNDPSEIYYYACTPLGSNYISTKIRNPVYFSMFFEKLKHYFPLLMVNSMGHTVCRAIYSQTHCTLSDKVVLLNSLIQNFSKIASNRQGSFALICIMSLVTTNTEIEVISKGFTSVINNNNNDDNDDEEENNNNNNQSNNNNNNNSNEFNNIILSQSGYHVIKKFISFGYPHFDCILDGISLNFTKYATHHYGVPIIRSILDMISANEHLIGKYSNYLKLFAKHTRNLVCNQYGNYVIQQLLEISPTFVTNLIKQSMINKYSQYSKHKFASNVVEKCLKHTLIENRAKQQQQLIEKKTITIEQKDEETPPNEEENDEENINHKQPQKDWSSLIIRELLCDAKILINHKYGNYCLQTALSVCIESRIYMNNDKLFKDFLKTIPPLLHLLRLNVRKKWQQLLLSATNNNTLNTLKKDQKNNTLNIHRRQSLAHLTLL